MVNKYFIIILVLLCLIIPCTAIPTTIAASVINSNGATFTMIGGVAPMWFEFGQHTGMLTWRTPNSSNSSVVVYGSPILGNTLFYFRSCDSTGCGNQLSFTTSVITPQPQTTFGMGLDNITNSQFDVFVIGGESIQGYFWLVPDFPTIVWALLFFGIYVGLWMRERDLVVPIIIGLITGTFLMFNDTGLNLGLPPEFISMAQAMTYAALAGIILSLVKRS